MIDSETLAQLKAWAIGATRGPQRSLQGLQVLELIHSYEKVMAALEDLSTSAETLTWQQPANLARSGSTSSGDS